MPTDPARVQAVFLAAADLADPAARAAYLDRECAADGPLRARVDALLRAVHQPDSLLDAPVVPAAGGETRTLAPPKGPDPAATRPHAGGADHDPGDAVSFLAPPGRPDSLGRIGHYEVLEVLGRGGFGIVYRAFDTVLQRVVAVKVLSPAMAVTSPARKRFLREARSSAQVRHENVVQVYAVEEQPLPYLVMEFVPGETLQQRLDRTGPLEFTEVLRLGRQVADGLAAAHAQGLIHRDIKPANILIESGPQERAKLTDFGLARAADDASISHSGVLAGTPMYMAPEQARGEALDPRADLFSLGSVVYAMLTGRPPFRASGALAVLKRVCEDDARPIREIIPEAPEWLGRIVEKLHAKRADERFGSAQEVAEVLGDCLRQLQSFGALEDYSRIPGGEPAPARPTKPAAPPRRRRDELRAWLPGAAGILFVVLVVLLPRLATRLPLDVPAEWVVVEQAVLMLALLAGGLWVSGFGAVRESHAGRYLVAAVLLAVVCTAALAGGLVLLQMANPVPVKSWAVPLIALGALAGLVLLLVGLRSLTPLRPFRVYELRKPLAGALVVGALVFLARLSLRERFLGQLVVSNDGGEVAVVLEGPDLPEREYPGKGNHREWLLRGEYVVRGRWRGLEVFTKVVDLRRGIDQRVDVPGGGTALAYHARPDVTFEVDGKAMERRPGGVTRMSVAVGRHLWAARDAAGAVVASGDFLVRPGEDVQIGPSAPKVADGPWVPLFNGKDLTGWKTLPGHTDDWRVEGTELVGRGPESYLFTDRGDYGDFHFRIVAQVKAPDASPTHHGGQLFRTEFGLSRTGRSGTRLPAGYDADIALSGDGRPAGGLVYPTTVVGGFDRVVADAATQPGAWFTQEVIAQGNHIVIMLNGKTVVDHTDPAGTYRVGHLALQALNGAVLRVRKIEVKELPGSVPAVPRSAAWVFPYLVGTWKVYRQDVDRKDVPEARLSFDYVADGRFLRGRGTLGPGSDEPLFILAHDRERDVVRSWNFWSNGAGHGTLTGRFDPGSRTLSSAYDDPLGGHVEQQFVFTDPNLVTLRTVVRAADGTVARDLRLRLTRLKAPVAPAASPDDPRRPPEMKVLDRLVGEWRSELSTRYAESPNTPKLQSARVAARPILGGRFIEMLEGFDPDGTNDYSVTWFDAGVKQYRSWSFDGSGTVHEWAGTWDETKQHLTWAGSGQVGRWTFRGDDVREFTRAAVGPDGKATSETTGTSRRIGPGVKPKGQ